MELVEPRSWVEPGASSTGAARGGRELALLAGPQQRVGHHHALGVRRSARPVLLVAEPAPSDARLRALVSDVRRR